MKAQNKTQAPSTAIEAKNRNHKIRICLGSSCFSKGKQSNLEYIEQFLKEHGITEEVDFAGHLCIEKCSSGPNIEIDNIMYHEVDPAKLESILNKVFMKA